MDIRCRGCGKDFRVEPEFGGVNLCYKHFPSIWGRAWDKIKRLCNWLGRKENKPSIFYPEILEQVYPYTLHEDEVRHLGEGADDR